MTGHQQHDAAGDLETPGIHAARITRRHCHHRHSGGVAVAVLSAAKKKAAQSTCIDNEKQLGLGMQIYVNDNGDIFPGIASR